MKLPVLNYHAVGTPNSDQFAEWCVDRADFAAQLDLLAGLGLRGVSMAQALADPRPDQVALTFDDGYEDFVTVAVPELEARGFAATVFVATANIGSTTRWLAAEGAGDRPIVSWEQLQDAERRGFEIGSHSHSHPQLDLLSARELRDELLASRTALTAGLGHDVAGFCYPHGFHDAVVRRAVIDAGFEYACGVKHKMAYVGQDVYSIARIVVRRDDPLPQIARWLNGDDLRPGGPRVERALATAFRVQRRLRHRLRGTRTETSAV